jgi:hypothetical protein
MNVEVHFILNVQTSLPFMGQSYLSDGSYIEKILSKQLLLFQQLLQRYQAKNLLRIQFYEKETK